ncbi:DUF1129 domain-containing protein [Enterococcus pseudoavium]|uniref:DUF1129 domain-containing protein n=1 Tax=Enterococcus pseudoavium TaxID=44007 RepID=A0AAE4I5H1_9ENTE|nr:DUF1129 domain-containing protein [Enterococcus pseudoavium]MDT2737996.1 DUF1129 domain-containing protein [Enterococcus pseudoavium]MDT2754012.1 DUF1129 domain-containing protein [Enterococcus pseudoavium]MDT2770206.1 DUF1129 domain-containing protein [Enterococcus pseudoavium]REC32692.1 DUF1129 domain-containing protein [Enterococcus pseudoavium]
MEPEKLRALNAENSELEAKLTKRNEQYIFDLKKALKAANLTEEQTIVALNEMLPTMVEEQKTGKTARQLFGTVSERLDTIVNKPAEQKKSTTASLMWLDNFLMIFGMLGLLTGIMGLFVSRGTQTVTYGLTALIVASAVGGLIFYMMYLFVYQYEQPGADKSKKPKTWKTVLMLGSVTLVWFLVFNGTALLPPSLNPILDPMVMVVLAAIALAVRYYLKKRFGIISSLASAPRK